MRLLRWAIRITIMLDRDKTFWWKLKQQVWDTVTEEFDHCYTKEEE